MIQPARVLPSNAPPLGDTDHGHSSRVLQEHSGNRQHHDYPCVNTSEQKYPASVLAENVYSGHQIPQPQHIYRQTPLQRHHYRHGHGRCAMGGDDRARIEKAARILYHRFRNSESYMKYRTRQHKDDKGNQGEQKWPDRVEQAFFEALVRWPPMGRRQVLHKGERRGRNELIADYIEEVTGEGRTRKQVSSHIQVLKPFVEGDPFIMRILSKEDLCGPGGQMWQRSGRMSSAYHDTRHVSTHPAMAQHVPSAAPTVLVDSHAIQKSKDLLNVFEPSEFHMFVQQKFKDDSVNRLHTYTHSISDPRREDIRLPSWPSLQNYPLLAAIHNVRPLDCNVLLAEASLAFPTRHFKGEDGKSLPGIELGISFLCNSRHLPVDAHVVCSTNFYRNGAHLKEHSGRAQVQLTESSEPGMVETQLKFGSNFWAKTLATLAGNVDSPATEAGGDPRRRVQAQIDGITAAQEVAVKTDLGCYERLLVIYWKFRLSSAEKGRAYWSRLVLPSAASSVAASAAEEGEERYPDPDLDAGSHLKPTTVPCRNDSVYDYSMPYTHPTPYASGSSGSGSGSGSVSQPALQSPFEYDSTSGSGSALTSATWPTLDETNTAPHSAIDGAFPDDAFAFEAGEINLSYDAPLDFSQFDAAAFDFSVSDPIAPAAGTTEYGTDPALGEFPPPTGATAYSHSAAVSREYSHPIIPADFSQPPPPSHQDFPHPWPDAAYSTTFDSQLSAGASSYPPDPHDDAATVFGPYTAHYDPSYHVPVSVAPEGQAYGGAGPDAGVKEEGPRLGALAGVVGARY